MDELLLLSGNDIPFIQAGLIIHQPSLKEISFIGEEKFYIGCELLNFSKDILFEEDKNLLEDKTNFEIIMSIMNENSGKNNQVQASKESIEMIFLLLFPDYEYTIQLESIDFKQNNQNIGSITKHNFEDFKEIINVMFCLKSDSEESKDYNPANEMAKKIADKLKKGRQKAAAANSENAKINILSKYVSILAVGEHKDMNVLLNYTIYQIRDEYERFLLKQNFDYSFQARLAGAKGLEDGKYWMDDIHNNI
jgi:hypothetical protein